MENNTTNTVPRMRTIPAAAEMFGLSAFTLRRWCEESKIIFVQCGRKKLVNIDKLAEFLNGEGGAVND